MARISIIVAFYNASTTLGACLDCIMKQTFTEWVCYLVNDGSKDDSQSVVDEYCRQDSRFICLNKANEGSPAKARQFAMPYVSTPFVSSIDADDLIDLDFFEKLIRRQAETGADVVMPYMHRFEDNPANVQWKLPDGPFDKEQVITGKEACLLTIPEWIVGFSGSLVKKELMLVSSSGKWVSSDELKTREILVNSHLVAFSDAVYYYRSNPESITSLITPRLFERTLVERQLVSFAEKYYPENPTLIEQLRRRHFSGLQYNILLFDKIKNQFTEKECKSVERILSESYHSIEVLPLIKVSFKWGIAVAFLRCFTSYQRLVLRHFKQSSGND